MKIRNALLALTLGTVGFTQIVYASAQTMPMPTKPDAKPTTEDQTQPNQDQQDKMGQGNMGPGKMGQGNMGPDNMGQGNMGHGKMRNGSAEHSKMSHKKHVKDHKDSNYQTPPTKAPEMN